jgi:hypothetical protein
VSGLRDDDGRRPPDPDGLPGLPEEWGHIVIPDDAAELDREASKVRRELRREALLRRYRIGGGRHHQLTLPLIVLALAILVTTTSLFAAMWPQHHRAASAAKSSSPSAVSPTPVTVKADSPMPDITLQTGAGAVKLRQLRPTVVLLMRGCACAGLVTDTVSAAAGTDVSVLVLGSGKLPAVPSLPDNQTRIVIATDPSDALAGAVDRSAATPPAATTASAVLVDKKGSVSEIVPSTERATDFAHAIAGLDG